MRKFKVHKVDRAKIKRWEAEGKPTIISAYASVQSEQTPGLVYNVVKYRKGGIFNAEGKALKFSCTCPGFQFRLKPCKHVAAFKKMQRAGK